ncbi:MAG: hypothetical protein IT386_12675 [Deltaproteobacteria bacterium]|nr:hypothetical protein [Deltaproteobacteria bacterium]
MRLRSLATLLLGAGLLVSAPAAFAATIWEADLLTSDKFALLPNRHATASVAADFEAFTITPDWSLGAAGSGLGDGKVPPSKTFTHTVAAPAGATIDKAWLLVSFSDDGFDMPPETGVVQIADLTFATSGWGGFGYLAPSPLVEVVGGDVTAALVAGGDGSLQVTVSSSQPDRDLYLHASLLKVQLSTGSGGGSPGTAVPEPGALLVFAAGLAVTAASLRDRGGVRAAA